VRWTEPARRASFLIRENGKEKELHKPPRGRQKEAPPRPMVDRRHDPGLPARRRILVRGGNDAGEAPGGGPAHRTPGAAGGRDRERQPWRWRDAAPARGRRAPETPGEGRGGGR